MEKVVFQTEKKMRPRNAAGGSQVEKKGSSRR